MIIMLIMSFLGGAMVENPPDNAGDTSSIPGSEISPGVGNDNLLQYSCLENSRQRSLVGYSSEGVGKTQTQLRTQASNNVKGRDL